MDIGSQNITRPLKHARRSDMDVGGREKSINCQDNEYDTLLIFCNLINNTCVSSCNRRISPVCAGPRLEVLEGY